MARHNRRSASSERFIKVNRSVYTSPAWRMLSTDARCAYLELLWRHRPTNNGEIPLSVRELGSVIGKSKDVAARALRELVTWGFTVMEQPGTLAGSEGKRRSARWRLTEHPTETKGPSREFEALRGQAEEAMATMKAFPRVQIVSRARRISLTGETHTLGAVSTTNGGSIVSRVRRITASASHQRDSMQFASVVPTQKSRKAMDMSDRNEYPPSIPLTRLYERTSRKGAHYLVGRLGAAKIVVLKSSDTADDGTAIWNVLLQEAPPKQAADTETKPRERQPNGDARRDWQRPLDTDVIPF